MHSSASCLSFVLGKKGFPKHIREMKIEANCANSVTQTLKLLTTVHLVVEFYPAKANDSCENYILHQHQPKIFKTKMCLVLWYSKEVFKTLAGSWMEFFLHCDTWTVPCSAIWCSEVQCSETECSAVQLSTVECSAVRCSAVRCSAAQLSSDKSSAVQCSAVQCNIL